MDCPVTLTARLRRCAWRGAGDQVQVERGELQERLRVPEGARRQQLSPTGEGPGGESAGFVHNLPEFWISWHWSV